MFQIIKKHENPIYVRIVIEDPKNKQGSRILCQKLGFLLLVVRLGAPSSVFTSCLLRCSSSRSGHWPLTGGSQFGAFACTRWFRFTASSDFGWTRVLRTASHWPCSDAIDVRMAKDEGNAKAFESNNRSTAGGERVQIGSQVWCMDDKV